MLSIVVHDLAWRADENVVFSDQEFPFNRIVWQSLQASGVETSCVDLSRCVSLEHAWHLCHERESSTADRGGMETGTARVLKNSTCLMDVLSE